MTNNKNIDRTEYIRNIFAPNDDFLENIEHNLHKKNTPIHLRAEDAKILQLLIRLGQIKNIVEIGTLAGYSTIWMARALPEDGHIYTIEHDPDRAQIARENFEKSDISDKITLLEGTAIDELKKLSCLSPFDMIFIDADKPSYLAYHDWAEHNIRKGGLIVGDNTFLFGAVYDNPTTDRKNPLRQSTIKTMKDFNKQLADPTKYCSIILPTKEGMTVAFKLF